MFQRKSFGPEIQPKVAGNPVTQSEKRSIEVGGKFNVILEYSSRVKRPPVTTFLGTLQNETFQVAGDKYLASRNTTLKENLNNLLGPFKLIIKVAQDPCSLINSLAKFR